MFTYKGLAGQIKYIEENIAGKKQLGQGTSFEEELLKEWRKYLPGGSKYRSVAAHSNGPPVRCSQK